jgi:N-methylhydantoinase A/oxoprolinase/acetone carboxylase beta subunit
MNYRLGIDVGGTNTDAVIIDEQFRLVAKVKTPTTKDVTTGIYNAIKEVLALSSVNRKDIRFAMLGTTHCTNAIVERKKLCRVGILRMGKPATESIMPMADWPAALSEAVGGLFEITTGGYEFDGRELTPLDEDELRRIFRGFKGKIESLAICCVFASIRSDCERRAMDIAKEELGDIPVSLSSEIGSLGLIERENATILNAALMDVASTVTEGFIAGLKQEGVDSASVYLCQNDGTLMSAEYTRRYPILTVACGPTNSIRGASFLSRKRDAVVLDVGGTTSDIGVISKGFPRESSLAVDIGGARTNFRMPDLVSIGLGGGSIVREEEGGITVGPDSVGYLLTEKAVVFGGDTLTATDIAVRLGMADIGDRSKVDFIDEAFARRAMDRIMEMVTQGIDKMKLSRDEVTLILVGGGSVLIRDRIEGVGEIIRPENFDVANALGSAIAQVSGEVDRIFTLDGKTREQVIEDAKNMAIDEARKAGADPATIEIVELEDIPLAYHPGNATRIKVKAAGNLLAAQQG